MADGASPLAFRGGEIRARAHPDTEVGAARPAGPVVLMPRRIPGGVAATLDALPGSALPRLAYEGPISGLRRALRAALAERLAGPRWLANWLLDDVLDQAALLVELSGAAALRVALDAGRGDESDAGFAVAEAPLRLVTSYRGPGLDWVSPRPAAGSHWADELSAAAVRRLPRGDVAVLRGPSPDGPGVPHRPARDPGGAALRLTIDAAERPAARATARTARAALQ